MLIQCEIIRDLLPLYADDACSRASRKLVEEHLAECPACAEELEKLKNTEIEDGLKYEKNAVIEYGNRRFKKRTATVGSVVAGVFMIPILACLIINIFSGAGMGWFFIVLSSLALAASLILVPILVPEDKGFWTFCAFCASLVILLGVICLVSRGHWFWIASSASLFGLGVFFLPFVIRSRPLKKWVDGRNRALLVIIADLVLFMNMMDAIFADRNPGTGVVILSVGCLAGVALAALEIIRKRG